MEQVDDREITETAVAAPERGTATRRPRRPKTLRWAILSVGALLVVFFGFVFGTRFGKDPTLVRSALIGKPAPEFDLPGLDGGRVRSADLLGRPYVVNFWASWCVPCRKEAPHLRSFSDRWRPRGVELVGIVWNDTEGDARKFRDEFQLRFPQAMDPSGRTALDFGVFGIPETYVVDARGIVMAKLVGAVGPTTLDEVLAQVRAGETYTRENDQYRSRP